MIHPPKNVIVLPARNEIACWYCPDRLRDSTCYSEQLGRPKVHLKGTVGGKVGPVPLVLHSSRILKKIVDCSFDMLQLPHLSMTLDWHLVVCWKRLRRWEHTPLQRTWLCEDLSSVYMGMCKARLKLQWDVDGCGPFGPTYNPLIGSAQTEVVAWTSSSTYSIWGTSTVLTNATLNRWNH